MFTLLYVETLPIVQDRALRYNWPVVDLYFRLTQKLKFKCRTKNCDFERTAPVICMFSLSH